MSAWKNKDNDPRLEGIASAIRVVPNFPKPGHLFLSTFRFFFYFFNLTFTDRTVAASAFFNGSLFLKNINSVADQANFRYHSGIMFKDITTLLLDPIAFKNTVDLFVERYTGKGINAVAGNTLFFPLLLQCPLPSFSNKGQLRVRPFLYYSHRWTSVLLFLEIFGLCRLW